MDFIVKNIEIVYAPLRIFRASVRAPSEAIMRGKIRKDNGEYDGEVRLTEEEMQELLLLIAKVSKRVEVSTEKEHVLYTSTRLTSS
jgi:hypothetical protein